MTRDKKEKNTKPTKISPQAQAKLDQGYTRTPHTCAQCEHYSSEIIVKKSNWGGPPHNIEANLRCGVGKFKIHKTAHCNQWRLK